MKDLLKGMMYVGIGAAFLTKEKIDELKSDLVEKGKLSQEEGKQFVEELMQKSEKAKDQVDLWINQRIEDRIKQLNIATSDDLADLRRQVEELQVALNIRSGE